ncbi:hypothetical protein [uncultured Megasphaera sp.]|uniref:hypothetical protein n=1 Tax=uncultured Megasphaera sp. TaxID=165188 RepID=UPI00266B55B7|nr:hypothetical protein [uncultured Megasphaera sp.]
MKIGKYKAKQTFTDIKTDDEIAVFYFKNGYGVVVRRKLDSDTDEKWETLAFCGNKIFGDKEQVVGFLKQIERLQRDYRIECEEL